MAVGLTGALIVAIAGCPTLADVSARVKSLKAMNWDAATSESVGGSSLRPVRPVARDLARRLVVIGWLAPRATDGEFPCAEMYSFAQPQEARADRLETVEFSVTLEAREKADAVVEAFRRLVGQPQDAESFSEFCIDCGRSQPQTGYRWLEGRTRVDLLIGITNERLISLRWSRVNRSPQ